MIRYYNNREISKILKINLARWKRWTREFLPPDPLGGLQSGYARQYSMREVFIVALGGHLVGFLKLSVHQVRTILTDLEPWLEQNGYFRWNSRTMEARSIAEVSRQQHCIFIRAEIDLAPENRSFCYAVRFCPELSSHIVEKEAPCSGNTTVEFINTPPEIQKDFAASPFLILLNIGQFRSHFLKHLYPAP